MVIVLTYITVTAHGKSEETGKQYLTSGPRRDHEELVVLKKDHGMVARNMGISDHQVFPDQGVRMPQFRFPRRSWL
jgi:hypothetical protein